MQVLIAKYSGFCEGVERAYGIALKQMEAGKPVFMLGNLVHNAQVIEKFKKLGTKLVKSIAEIPSGTDGILLISAHGVAPEVYKEATLKGLEIVDTTCPWVVKAQKIAKELAEEGQAIIIIGDQGHAEVKGLVGWSKGKAQVAETLEDLNKLSLTATDKAGVLAQTTQSKDHYQTMVKALKAKINNLKEYNTICGATAKRQEAAVTIAEQVDIMLVIGDKMSANTKRLSELCSQTGTETHQIQTVQELEMEWLKGKTKVGITAGASTPEWVIQEIIGCLSALITS
jgi:4-hydroxy-3-methylbut-2-enyl diphosphate reductase